MTLSEVLASATQYLAVLEKYSNHPSKEVSNAVKMMIEDVKKHIAVLSSMTGINIESKQQHTTLSVPSTVKPKTITVGYQDPMVNSIYNAAGGIIAMAAIQMILPMISTIIKGLGKQ